MKRDGQNISSDQWKIIYWNTIFDLRYIATISILILLAACGETKVEHTFSTKEDVANKEAVLKTAVYGFNDALMKADTVALNDLVHDKISYGHSNGWIENKTELKEDLYNGTLTYHKVDQPKIEIMVHDNIATVRGDGIFDVDYKGYEHLVFDLHVMQTWVYEDKRWQLLNRQSVSNKKQN